MTSKTPPPADSANMIPPQLDYDTILDVPDWRSLPPPPAYPEPVLQGVPDSKVYKNSNLLIVSICVCLL